MGAQVFIAHSTKDAVWLQRLTTMLAPLYRAGLSCWDETQIVPGQHRQAQIAEALGGARVAVLLVSPDFLAFNAVFHRQLSGMIAAQPGERRLKILWVAVRPCLWQESELASYQPASDPGRPLAGLPDSEADAALVGVCQNIYSAVGGSLAELAYSEPVVAVPSASGLTPRPKSAPPPPKSAYDVSWYLERADEEARARAAWAAPGAPVVLQAPELFGKTWLLMRLLAELKERGRTVYINLKTLGDEALGTFSTFLRELARLTLESCALPPALLEQAWGRSGNPEANLNWLMSTQVLRGAGPGAWLVLALDGADALADKPYFDRFLTLLRGMAEQAAIAPWGALRIILTLSSTVALRGQDIHRSPLENVAQIIPLSDLLPTQVAQMAAWHGHGDRGSQALQELVSGHPYLVHLALHEAQHRKQPLEEILAPRSRVFDPYLQLCRKRLQQQPELYQALRTVIAEPQAVIDPAHATRLIDAGFLSDEYDDHDQRRLHLRYRLYRRLA